MKAHCTIIEANFTELCDRTRCTTRLLDKCAEKQVITCDIRDELALINNKYDQASSLYKIVKKIDDTQFRNFLEIIQSDETRYDGAFKILSKDIAKDLHLRSTWFEVVEPYSRPVGRRTKIAELHDAVVRGSFNTNPSKISWCTAITGMAGVGKTTLALQYISTKANYFTNVCWINAESSVSAQRSFSRLAKKLGICNKISKTDTCVPGMVYEHFSNTKCLFVFDGVNEFKDSLEQWLPRYCNNGFLRPYILITTRNVGLIQKAKIFPLDVFKYSESLELFQQELVFDISKSNDNIDELIFKLDGLPLALQQSAVYINKLHSQHIVFCIDDDPIRTYINSIDSRNLVNNILDFKYFNETGDGYNNTIFCAWDNSIDALKKMAGGNEAIVFLNVLAFLDPIEIRVDIFDRVYDMQEYQLSLYLLVKYSLIATSNGTVCLNKTLQMVLREKCKNRMEIINICFSIFRMGDYHSMTNHKLTVWNHILYFDLVNSFPMFGFETFRLMRNDVKRKHKYEETLRTYKSIFDSDSRYYRTMFICHSVYEILGSSEISYVSLVNLLTDLSSRVFVVLNTNGDLKNMYFWLMPLVSSIEFGMEAQPQESCKEELILALLNMYKICFDYYVDCKDISIVAKFIASMANFIMVNELTSEIKYMLENINGILEEQNTLSKPVKKLFKYVCSQLSVSQQK